MQCYDCLAIVSLVRNRSLRVERSATSAVDKYITVFNSNIHGKRFLMRFGALLMNEVKEYLKISPVQWEIL